MYETTLLYLISVVLQLFFPTWKMPQHFSGLCKLLTLVQSLAFSKANSQKLSLKNLEMKFENSFEAFLVKKFRNSKVENCRDCR